LASIAFPALVSEAPTSRRKRRGADRRLDYPLCGRIDRHKADFGALALELHTSGSSLERAAARAQRSDEDELVQVSSGVGLIMIAPQSRASLSARSCA
jgi:hypothetical protein